MIKDYIKDNWDGWPLHTCIAAAFMVAGNFYPLEALLAANTAWWPDREATQHDGWGDIWTLHRILEWGCPVLIGIVLYVVIR